MFQPQPIGGWKTNLPQVVTSLLHLLHPSPQLLELLLDPQLQDQDLRLVVKLHPSLRRQNLLLELPQVEHPSQQQHHRNQLQHLPVAHPHRLRVVLPLTQTDLFKVVLLLGRPLNTTTGSQPKALLLRGQTLQDQALELLLNSLLQLLLPLQDLRFELQDQLLSKDQLLLRDQLSQLDQL